MGTGLKACERVLRLETGETVAEPQSTDGSNNSSGARRQTGGLVCSQARRVGLARTPEPSPSCDARFESTGAAFGSARRRNLGRIPNSVFSQRRPQQTTLKRLASAITVCCAEFGRGSVNVGMGSLLHRLAPPPQGALPERAVTNSRLPGLLVASRRPDDSVARAAGAPKGASAGSPEPRPCRRRPP